MCEFDSSGEVLENSHGAKITLFSFMCLSGFKVLCFDCKLLHAIYETRHGDYKISSWSVYTAVFSSLLI